MQSDHFDAADIFGNDTVVTRAAKVHVARNIHDARAWSQAWQALASECQHQNAFYMPWFVLPALAHLPLTSNFQIIFVTDPADEQRLIGVFPLVRRAKFKGLPLQSMTTWQHNHVFFAVPLVDRQHTPVAWAAMKEWAKSEGAYFLDLPLLPAEQSDPAGFEAERFSRSILRPDPEGSEKYLQQIGSAKSRKRWRRQLRRLDEQGDLELRKLGSSDQISDWITDFLQLEANGWKGEGQTAIASDSAEAGFFEDMAKAAHSVGALHMLGYYLDGEPVAMQCNLMQGGVGFAFKVAFDESYAQQSPGVLLELAAMNDFHDDQALEYVDSCAKEGHVLMGRLWKDEREIIRHIIPVGGIKSRLICSCIRAAMYLRGLSVAANGR